MDNREKRERSSWEFIKNRIDDRKAYIELYKFVIRGDKIPSEKKTKMESLESRFEYDDIILFRKAANKVVDSEIKAKKELKKQAAAAAAPSTPAKVSPHAVVPPSTPTTENTPKKASFFERLFSKTDEAPKTPGKAPQQPQQLPESPSAPVALPANPASPSSAMNHLPIVGAMDASSALKELYEGMGINQSSEKQKYPVGYVITKLKFSMPSATINIRDSEKPDTIVASVDLQQAQFLLQIREGRSWRVQSSLNDFVITDFFTKRPHVAFQNGGKLDPEEAQMLVLRKSPDSGSSSALASVIVDFRPPNLKKNNLPVDLAVDVSLMPSEVTITRPLLDRISQIFAPPRDNAAVTRSVTEAASNFAVDAFETFKRRAQQSLKFAMQNRQVYDIRLIVNAPRITAPRSFDSPSSPALLINLGRGEITSDVSAIASSLESSTLADNFFYDTFQLNLVGVSAFLVPNMQAAKVDWNDLAGLSSMAIVDRTDVGGVIQLASVATAKIPRLKVAFNVRKLHLSVSRESLETSLGILESIFYSQVEDVIVAAHAGKSITKKAAETGYNYVVNQLMDADTRAKLVDAAATTLSSAATSKVLFAELSFELTQLEIDITQRLQLGSRPTSVPLSFLDLHGVSARIAVSNEEVSANFVLVGLFVEDTLVERSEGLLQMLSEVPETISEQSLTASAMDMYSPTQLPAVAGEKIFLLKSGSEAAVEGQPLIHVKLTVLNRNSPQFEGTDMLAAVSLGSIDVSSSRPTAAALLQFFIDVSDLFLDFGKKEKKKGKRQKLPKEQPASTASSEPSAVEKAISDALGQSTAEALLESALGQVGIKEKSSRYLDAVFDFAGFRFALKKGKKEFFEFRLSNLHVSAEVHKTMKVGLRGSLRDLSARDLDDPKWGECISVMGDRAAVSFEMEYWHRKSVPEFPGHQLALKVDVASLRFVVLSRLLKEMAVYASLFTRMFSMFGRASGGSGSSSRPMVIKFDVKAGNPLLVIPRDSDDDESVVLDLGRIEVSNKLEFTEDKKKLIVDSIHVVMEGLQVVSRVGGPHSVIDSPPLLQRIGLEVMVVRNVTKPEGSILPDVSIATSVPNITLVLPSDRLVLVTGVVSGNIMEAPRRPDDDELRLVSGLLLSGIPRSSSGDDLSPSIQPKVIKMVESQEKKTVGPTVDFSCSIEEASVEFAFTYETVEDLETSSFMLFTLRKTNIQVGRSSLGRTRFQVSAQELWARDTRPGIPTQQRVVLSPHGSGSSDTDRQISVSYTVDPVARSANVHVALHRPRIYAVPSHVDTFFSFLLPIIRRGIHERAKYSASKLQRSLSVQSRQKAIMEGDLRAKQSLESQRLWASHQSAEKRLEQRMAISRSALGSEPAQLQAELAECNAMIRQSKLDYLRKSSMLQQKHAAEIAALMDRFEHGVAITKASHDSSTSTLSLEENKPDTSVSTFSVVVRSPEVRFALLWHLVTFLTFW